MSGYAQVPELFTLASIQSDRGAAAVSEAFVLVSTGPPPPRFIDVSEACAFVSVLQDKPVAQVSEAFVLVSYVTGPATQSKSRAWGFTFDMHQFYVLHLGNTGTWVYDTMTDQWSQWGTEGIITWNMEYGVEWNGGVYAGDQSNGTIWKLDPDSYLDDDFRLITRRVTGFIPMNGRKTMRTGSLILATTPQTTLEASPAPSVSLSISDDKGVTWNNRGSLTVVQNRTQDLSWRGLGLIRAPGRVFKIEDVGGLLTIDGADLEDRNEQD